MSQLKTIIQINHEELRRNTPVPPAVQTVLDSLKTREAEVVMRRYGLDGGANETLQEIGERYGVSRERVRQIEQAGLKAFRAQLTNSPLKEIVSFVVSVIRENGGVVAQEELVEHVLLESQRTPAGRAAVTFLVSNCGLITEQPESKKFRALYATSPAHVRAAEQVESLLTKILKQKETPQSVADLYAAVQAGETAGIRYLLDETLLQATLETAKTFTRTEDGLWGLSSWSDINPRNIRDKTLYTLRHAGEPMHFTEITKRIEEAGFDQKRVTTQAVHNELINGSEFVLIGRGIYALKEWGFLPGTVAEVIIAILKETPEPLDREEIVRLVLKQRHVSRNTILINLQEKSLFTKVDKHTYRLAAAEAEQE